MLLNMTNNGKIDLFIGNYAGGITFLENGKKIITTINKIKNITSFNLYPVPASDYVHLEFNSAGPAQNINLCIYNLLGKVVKNKK